MYGKHQTLRSTGTNSFAGDTQPVGKDGCSALVCSSSPGVISAVEADGYSAFATIVAAAIFLGTGIAGLKNRAAPTDLYSLIEMGFGTVQPKSFVNFFHAGVWMPDTLPPYHTNGRSSPQ